ncbi:Uncharacterised protein [Mycolicibacterium phlei]|nr:hypothetical protein BKG56_00230 [Mycobacteroides chelonae]VEG15134.1 Uncharacterised protein [Mycolicibacterium phlei]
MPDTGCAVKRLAHRRVCQVSRGGPGVADWLKNSPFLLQPKGIDQLVAQGCTGSDGSDAQRQARVCVTVRDVLTRAGLSTTTGIKPSSLTAHAARQVFEETGRIELAAKLIGSGSLDGTAALIGYQWRQDD